MIGSDEIVLLEEASYDMLDGKAFYERRHKGLGSYFWLSLLADLESLKLYAGIHAKHHGFYRMKSKRFPYAIYYEQAEKMTHVVAVLPMRRKPTWI